MRTWRKDATRHGASGRVVGAIQHQPHNLWRSGFPSRDEFMGARSGGRAQHALVAEADSGHGDGRPRRQHPAVGGADGAVVRAVGGGQQCLLRRQPGHPARARAERERRSDLPRPTWGDSNSIWFGCQLSFSGVTVPSDSPLVAPLASPVEPASNSTVHEYRSVLVVLSNQHEHVWPAQIRNLPSKQFLDVTGLGSLGVS